MEDVEFPQEDYQREYKADDCENIVGDAKRLVVWDYEGCDLNSKSEVTDQDHQLYDLEKVVHQEFLVDQKRQAFEFSCYKLREYCLDYQNSCYYG